MQPTHPIARGRAGPNLPALVPASTSARHLPLNRQSGILAREGVDLDASTPTGWVGASAASLAPLIEAVRAHMSCA